MNHYTHLKPGDFVFFVEGSIWPPCQIQKIFHDEVQPDLIKYDLTVEQPFAILFGTDNFTVSQVQDAYYFGMWRFYSKKDFKEYYGYRLVILYFINTILLPVWLWQKLLRIHKGERK